MLIIDIKTKESIYADINKKDLPILLACGSFETANGKIYKIIFSTLKLKKYNPGTGTEPVVKLLVEEIKDIF